MHYNKFSTDFLQEDMRKLGRWLHSLEGRCWLCTPRIDIQRSASSQGDTPILAMSHDSLSTVLVPMILIYSNVWQILVSIWSPFS